MRIITEITEISKSQKHLFDFLSDFNNYAKLMPPSISNWKATKDYCIFVKDKFVNIGMQFENKIECSEIKIVNYAKNAFPYSLTIIIDTINESKSTTQMIFEGTPNAFLKLVVEKPLGLFFNNLNKSLTFI